MEPAILIANIIYFVLLIVILIGFIQITRLSMGAEVAKVPGTDTYISCTKDFSNTDLTYSKITIWFVWVLIALNVFASLWLFFYSIYK